MLTTFMQIGVVPTADAPWATSLALLSVTKSTLWQATSTKQASIWMSASIGLFVFMKKEHNLPGTSISWTIPQPVCAIRTVLFNWPIDGVKHRMFYKEQMSFMDLTVEDFGLNANDQDTHVPQFLMLTKSPVTAAEGSEYRQIFRTRSDEGKEKDKARRNQKRHAKRQAQKEERAFLRSSSSKASSSTTPAASSWEPVPKATQSK